MGYISSMFNPTGSLSDLILKFTILSAIFVFGLTLEAHSQNFGNTRIKVIPTNLDTVTIDTLSIIPGSMSFSLNTGEKVKNDSIFSINEAESQIIFNPAKKSALPDSLFVVYKVFPLLLTQPYKRRDRTVIEKSYSGLYNPFSYNEQDSDNNIFKLEGLQRNGNISRGVSFGNNQDVVVNSSFNLQLSGKISDDVEILAAITDNNIPVQPEGNTQQIQDFDKVYIQLSKNKTKLLVGDFELRRPESYFMNFFKKGQGGVFSSEYQPGIKKNQVMRTTVSGAISKGKFARNVFEGLEANQGPYKLIGAENESYIVVLSGTEKVFIDGIEMIRGEQFDYVIDYNTAEIRFTTRRPITKDKRIVVEFQYSDKNYSRTLIYINQEYEDEKFKIKANIFSEQDAKNQPLQQDLDEEQKLLLASVGDSIQDAFYQNIDSIPFNSTEVLYAKQDSSGYEIYVYSTDSTEAFFRLGFSFVGANKGNYIPVAGSANGRVFQWVIPVNNIPQGSYEPVSLLISPKKQQLFTLGANYKITPQSNAFFEAAYSNYDVNLFSSSDKEDDGGYAFAGGVEHISRLSADSLQGWKLISAVRLEHVNKQFKPLENFRNTEFNRDWNLGNNTLEGDENAAGISLTLAKPGQRIGYQVRTFIKGNDYTGLMNILNLRVGAKKFILASDASYLYSDGPATKTSFMRSATDLSRQFKNLIIGIKYDQERNRITDAITDSLEQNSFSFDAGKFYVTSSDTAKIRFRIDVSRRYDYSVRNNNFKKYAEADEISGKIEFLANPKSRLTLSSSYRNLQIVDTILSSQLPEESILNRIEYNATILKGFIALSTFYEAGTGQELKKEYAYLEVAPGTGVYTYAGDYNGNGVKDLDEFEIAAFADQANFVKVYLPTNEFVKTRTNQFSQVLTLNPGAYFQKQDGFQKFIARFSDQISYRVDNKTLESDLLKSLNPFSIDIDDDLLITTNSAFRNTLSFNRSSTVFGMDVTWQDTRNKAILTNGFESRQLQSFVSNVRWNITRVYSFNLSGENGTKSNSAEYSSTRDYDIVFNSFEPKFSVQPGISFRTTLLYNYTLKENILSEINETTDQNTLGVEMKYSSVKRGILTAKFNLIQIDYNAPENTSIAYEMLEGLKKGRNYTWGLSLQRTLSNSIQVNLNYEGRKPTGTNIIHTGGVQARAFF